MAPVTIGVNFFGAVATLEYLRPLLKDSDAPRAVAVTSTVSIFPVDDTLVALLAGNDEASALRRATELSTKDAGHLIYPSSKKALAQWIRRTAPTEPWAGAGIPLNAIAPGVIVTPMSAHKRETEEGRLRLKTEVPMPLNGFAEAIVPARLLAWLVSDENSHLCGQVIFIDGGSDAVHRGDSTW
jgi:NAD(P)-dependent dehydrogenase (short-subunit alcohol dehydrogenase family)